MEKEAVTDHPALLGVVAPPEDIEEPPFTWATRTAQEALERCQSRLIELRAQRSTINAEVASLVTQETALKRMVRITLPAEEGT
jgi:hypothetical protein